MSRACALAPTSRSATLIWRGSSAACAGDPGHHVAEPGVDVEDFAGNRGSQVGQQERGGVADVLGGHIAAQRRMLLDELEDPAEAADARRGERLDRPGGDAVDADALRVMPSRKSPAIASRGAKAMACTRPSRPSQYFFNC